jgi:3-oxoacyl-(acyl-carrier-protein) synthase
VTVGVPHAPEHVFRSSAAGHGEDSAAGAVETIVTVLSIKESIIPQTPNLKI